jgi:thioredoxin reductase (NADPH)
MMEDFKAQAERFGTDTRWGMVTKVDLSERPFKIEVDEKETILAETVIIATGASAKWLGMDDEIRLNGYGVSACATCDGFFYKGKEVVVVGAGDTAAEEATYLAKMCTKVTILVRRDEMRASKAMQHRVFNTPNLEVLFNHETKSINGEPGPVGVESVTAINNITKEETVIPASGFFVAIGHKPNSDLFKGQLEMDDAGYLLIEAGTSKTKIPGVFAAGDIADHVYRQAVTSAGTGCMAALDAERFLADNK